MGATTPTPQPEPVNAQMLAALKAKSTAAYCEYINTLRRDECLGWEYKVQQRKFGEPELKAHTRAAEHLGMYRAFSAAAADIRAAIAAAEAAQAQPAAVHDATTSLRMRCKGSWPGFKRAGSRSRQRCKTRSQAACTRWPTPC